MASPPRNPDLPRDATRGLAGASDSGDTSNARGARPQDTAGRQSYGASGGTSTGQRDFYREAVSRSRTQDFDRYGQGLERYGGPQGRSEGSRDLPQYGPDEGLRGEPYRGEGSQGPRRHEGSRRTPGGRTLALGAAGLAAAGVGLGLMRRSRWAKEPLSASEVMSRGVRTVLPEHTLREVARLMREEDVGIVPVTDTQGRLLGVVTDRDLVVRAMSEDKLPSQVRVVDIMSSDDLEVATPDDAVSDIIELMGKQQVRRIPVVERDDRLVGIIAMADIATRAEFDEELQAALERISSRRSFWSRLG